MQFFISGDRPNVAGLVLAGSAEFKSELSESDMFDQRLKAAVLAVVDVSYGERLCTACICIVCLLFRLQRGFRNMYNIVVVQACNHGDRASWAEPRFRGVVRRKVALQEARTVSIRPSSSAEKLSPM